MVLRIKTSKKGEQKLIVNQNIHKNTNSGAITKFIFTFILL
jgi:hypothetical protein